MSNSNLLKAWFQTMNLEYSYFPSQSSVKEVAIQSENKKYDSKSISQTQRACLHKIVQIKGDIVNSSVEKARSIANKIANLSDLYKAIRDFNECSLKQTAINTVIYDGNANSDVMIVGEAPGASEDEQGIPFCGESGKLLDLILKSIDLSRKQNTYITNTVFWRPPANRRPTDVEIAICRPFLEKHIALINPKLLLLVGSTAVASLFGQEMQITKIRRQYYEYQNTYLEEPIITTAIFHPAYLLRQPLKKKETWFDVLTIKKFLEGNLIFN
jgi:uracil-DNA glycosylase family 4